MNELVVVNYRTRKDYCTCCEQKLPNPKTSELRDFTFTQKNAKEWANWNEIAEYEDDLQEIVTEYVYETISFFATSSDEKILVEKSEFDKVKQFILEKVVTA